MPARKKTSVETNGEIIETQPIEPDDFDEWLGTELADGLGEELNDPEFQATLGLAL